MASRERINVVGYAGVFYVETTRANGKGTEKIYYIRYRKDGKQIEEKAGGQYRDNMTVQKAANIRLQKIEGKEATNEERRQRIKQAKAEEEAKYTFDKLWQLFFEAKSANRTLKDDRVRYTLHISPHIGGKSIDSLNNTDIENIRSTMAQAGKAPQTIKHVLTLAKRLINFALRQGYIDNIPPKLHIAMPEVDNQVTENLTAAQVRKMFQALDEEPDQINASVVRLALFTGMRKGALFNLKWDDLDFERGFITLRGEVAKKGKTETIPMNEQARAVLQAIPRLDSPFVFPGRNKNKPITNISPMLHRIRDKVGLPKNFRPLHGLRHVFASWLASSGDVSMYELQKLLTHASPQMTQRYAHLHDDALKKASGVASNLFGAISAGEVAATGN